MQKIANEKEKSKEENQQINTATINNEKFKVIILEKCTVHTKMFNWEISTYQKCRTKTEIQSNSNKRNGRAYWVLGRGAMLQQLKLKSTNENSKIEVKKNIKIGKKEKENKHLNHVSTYNACVTHLRFNLCCLVNGKRFDSI